MMKIQTNSDHLKMKILKNTLKTCISSLVACLKIHSKNMAKLVRDLWALILTAILREMIFTIKNKMVPICRIHRSR